MYLFTCLGGAEDLLQEELVALGADPAYLKVQPGAIRWQPPGAPAVSSVTDAEGQTLALTALLHSRLASRVLLQVGQFPCGDAQALYQGVRALAWAAWLRPDVRLAVRCPLAMGALTHTQYAAQVTKDAIVDVLRRPDGTRPTVDLRTPEMRVHLLLRKNFATVSLDLTGEGLHRRGYRSAGGGAAPLRETLAAAMLLRCGWPKPWRTLPQAEAWAHLPQGVDPLCGSATLLIEAAWMAAQVPPSALGRDYAVQHWLPLDSALWQRLRAEAKAQGEAGFARLGALTEPFLFGYDRSAGQLADAGQAVRAARAQRAIRLARQSLREASLPPAPGPAGGLVLTNAPYGERLAPNRAELLVTYGELGQYLARLPQYSRHVLTTELALGRALGLRAHRKHALANGPLACTLLHFAAEPQGAAQDVGHAVQGAQAPKAAAALPKSAGAAGDFARRLQKNLKKLAAYLAQHRVRAFRLYDADLPQFNVALDVYDGEDGQRRLHVQEYLPPKQVSPARAEAHLAQLVRVLPETLAVRPEHIFLKVRRRTRPEDQYGAEGRTVGQGPRTTPQRRDYFEVEEDGLYFWVSLNAYIDTGLYLDHRRLRHLVRSMAAGQDVLNLFCYTASVSVAAAAGGAASTTSVDLSKTYLGWAADNLARNHFAAPRHALVHADVAAYLAEARAKQRQFDLIYCGPPTFTNSKRMRQDFDVVQDSPALIAQIMPLLRPNGRLLFASHAQKLRLDAAAVRPYTLVDWTHKSVPPDFARARPHQLWCLTK